MRAPHTPLCLRKRMQKQFRFVLWHLQHFCTCFGILQLCCFAVHVVMPHLCCQLGEEVFYIRLCFVCLHVFSLVAGHRTVRATATHSWQSKIYLGLTADSTSFHFNERLIVRFESQVVPLKAKEKKKALALSSLHQLFYCYILQIFEILTLWK